MTWVHLILLVLGVVAAIIAADLLGHVNVGVWPIGLVVLVLIIATGWLYSGNLAAVTLGLATGFSVVSGRDLMRKVQGRRRARSDARRAADELRARQLEGKPAAPARSRRRRS